MSRRAGIALIAVLPVAVIIGVAAAVAVPAFAKSFRGAKLRASTRMVLAMHRNAQTKAVLGQRYMALFFDQAKGTVEMYDQGQIGVKQDQVFGTLGETAAAGMGAEVSGAEAAAGETAAAPPGADSLLVRKLEDGVKIADFDGGREIDDLFYVNYYPNGMCEGYELELADDEQHTARIKVNAITGKAQVDRGR